MKTQAPAGRNLFKEPRLKNVEWKDLVKLSNRETFIENTITLPWLVASLLLAYFKMYWLALPCSFMFFLTGLRQAHNGFHNSLGTGKWYTWLALYINSILMLSSMHAIKYNHLRHHKYCLTDDDHEGKAARMKGIYALLYGPVHIFEVHRTALQYGTAEVRKNVVLDMISIAAFIAAVLYFDIPFLKFHLLAMAIGEGLSAFFAVWTVHHDCDDFIFARTQRKGWKNMLTYSMFYHLEHHLFPTVPTIKLPELAKRIDNAFPDLPIKEVF